MMFDVRVPIYLAHNLSGNCYCTRVHSAEMHGSNKTHFILLSVEG